MIWENPNVFALKDTQEYYARMVWLENNWFQNISTLFKLLKSRVFIKWSITFFLVTVNVTESCANTYDSTIQQIHYPPANAENDTLNNCSWRIAVPEDRAVVLSFIELQFSSPRHCDNSFLEVFDGFGIDSDRISDKICGLSAIEEIESSGNELILRFTSTSLNGTDTFKVGYDVSGSYIGLTYIQGMVCKNPLPDW